MKGIMFNSEYGMWEAVLLNMKSNTRRTGKAVEQINKDPDSWRFMVMDGHRFKLRSTKNNQIAIITPKYKINDVCYLQEPVMNTQGILSEDKQIFYQEKDHNGYTDLTTYKPLIDQAKVKGATWTNKRFMSQIDARYFVQITDVKLERLQDISNEDCIKEGIHNKTSLGNRIYLLYEKNKYYKANDNKFTRDPKQSYESLFKIVNDKEPWDDNHWCISYHFKLLTNLQIETLKQKNQFTLTNNN